MQFLYRWSEEDGGKVMFRAVLPAFLARAASSLRLTLCILGAVLAVYRICIPAMLLLLPVYFSKYHGKPRQISAFLLPSFCDPLSRPQSPTLGCLVVQRTGHAIWDWTGTIKSADTTHNSQDAIRMLNERQTQVNLSIKKGGGRGGGYCLSLCEYGIYL